MCGTLCRCGPQPYGDLADRPWIDNSTCILSDTFNPNGTAYLHYAAEQVQWWGGKRYQPVPVPGYDAYNYTYPIQARHRVDLSSRDRPALGWFGPCRPAWLQCCWRAACKASP